MRLLSVQFIYFLFNVLRSCFRWLLSFHCASVPRVFCMFTLLRKLMEGFGPQIPQHPSLILWTQRTAHTHPSFSLTLRKHWRLFLASLLIHSGVISSFPPGNILRYLSHWKFSPHLSFLPISPCLRLFLLRVPYAHTVFMSFLSPLLLQLFPCHFSLIHNSLFTLSLSPSLSLSLCLCWPLQIGYPIRGHSWRRLILSLS